MFGVSFETTRAVERAHPARADIALFVGWTTRRSGAAVPRAVAEWLRARRHVADKRYQVADWVTQPLLDMPVPVDTWQVFDDLFDWHARPVDGSSELADDWLGLAVRDFFANGGRKAYVVRLGDPWPLGAAPGAFARLAALLGHRDAADVLLRGEALHGVAHAWVLDDVSLVLVPDLAALHADLSDPLRGEPAEPAAPPEDFVECGTVTFTTPPSNGVRGLPAPRLSDVGFERWNASVTALRGVLARQRRDVMLLVAAPLAARDTVAARNLAAAVTLQTSMVECATPWLLPLRAVRTPEGLVPPDGALAGLIAASVLANGPVRPAAGLAPQGVLAVVPQPGDRELRSPSAAQELRDLSRPGARRDSLPLACSFALFGPTAAGIQLLSDPSLSAVPQWQSAGVVRLLGQLLRTARSVGATLVFEPSGEALWARVRSRFEDMLARYWEAGALRGARADDAFSVRCDRSVMTQSDLDNGRVVVLVEFTPQAAIERLRIELALAEDGSVHWQDADALGEVHASAAEPAAEPTP
jgi:uncharacterized protein